MTVKTIQYPVNIAEPLYVELKSLAGKLGISISKLILKSIEEKYHLEPQVIKIVAPKSEGIAVTPGEEFNYQLFDLEEIKTEDESANYDHRSFDRLLLAACVQYNFAQIAQNFYLLG
jgi:hypothetical protein